jgi:outer membrane translocation and assembly module TamA
MPRPIVRLLAAALLLVAGCAHAQAQAAGPEVVTEVRIHGNYRTPDAEVLKLAGIAAGSPLESGSIEAAADRMRRSGRFEAVEVRKRYRSLDDMTQVAVIIAVTERPGVEEGGAMPGPLKRMRNAVMASPSLEYVDGYGLIAGGRLSFVNVLGKGGHIVAPLTVGSTRQAGIELDKTFGGGPGGRVHGGYAIISRENPGYDIRDLRHDFRVEGSRQFGRMLTASTHAGWADVSFGDVHDQLVTGGARLSVDTRVNPAFPRNAIYASAGWEALSPDSGATVNRYTLDGQAYVGFVGSSVLALRARTETVDRPLPVYERALVGGFGSLRGFRAGAFAGDNAATASLELRVPFHSPLRLGQTGLAFFGDAGAAYEHGVKLSDARFEYGVGGGWYLRVPLFQLEVDVAYGFDSGTRVHVAAGLKF